jgi:RNA polymerase primary sigma factor
MLKIANEPISLDMPVGDDGDTMLGDLVEDADTLGPEEAAMQTSLRAAVKEMLDTLTPREAKVLRMRYGVEMTEEHTLEDIGKQFESSRENIRKVEKQAMSKLRHPAHAGKLRDLLKKD